jgi:hypothetical protein
MTYEELEKATRCPKCGSLAELKFRKEITDPSHPEQFEKAYFYRCINCTWRSEVKARVPQTVS